MSSISDLDLSVTGYLSSSSNDSPTNSSAQNMLVFSSASPARYIPSSIIPASRNTTKVDIAKDDFKLKSSDSPHSRTSSTSKKTHDQGMKRIKPTAFNFIHETIVYEDGEDYLHQYFSYKELFDECVSELKFAIKNMIERIGVFQRIDYIEMKKTKKKNKSLESRRSFDICIDSQINLKKSMKPATQEFVIQIVEDFKAPFQELNKTDLPSQRIEQQLAAMKKRDAAYLEFLKWKNPREWEVLRKKESEKLNAGDLIKPFVTHFDARQSDLILGDFTVGLLSDLGYIEILNANLPDYTENFKARIKELLNEPESEEMQSSESSRPDLVDGDS